MLADPVAAAGWRPPPCEYADGIPADPIAFLTLNHLVRLWRRLGWTLTETDRALGVFLPAEPDPYGRCRPRPGDGQRPARPEPAGRAAALLKGGRTELLELWADLTAARYAELFLVPGTPPIDPVFDHPLARYLEHLDGARFRPYTWDPALPESAADGNVGLAAHAGTVQAALRLSAEDVVAILADAGTTLEAAALNLPTVSLLHRYAVLARGLRIAVADLIALRQLSGLDPFGRPPPGPVTTLAEDRALTTVLFAEAVDAVRAGGLAVAEIDYLLRHRYDPAGPYLTAAAAPLALVRTLDTEIGRISTEHADPVDATALTDAELRQKMALVLPADAVERFFGMLTGTITYDAVVVDVPATEQLDPAAVAGEPAVTLTTTRSASSSTWSTGACSSGPSSGAWSVRFPGPAAARDRYAQLLDSVRRTAREFFDLNLLAPVGFLDAADYDQFFAAVADRGGRAAERLTVRRDAARSPRSCRSSATG